jgi:hypothetical protein
MSNLTVANTILEQLGGGRFIAMTGAKSFVGGEDSLHFSIPKSKDGINKVRIILAPSDTYRMEFYKARGIECALIGEMEMVYAEDLRRIFTSHTGLHTNL